MDQNLNNTPVDSELLIDEQTRAKKAKRARIWDKVTTGILIALMCSPVLILGYIFLWFVFR